MSAPEPGCEAPARRRGRLVLAALFVVFFAPVVTALWLNTGGAGLLSLGRVNHGELVEPPVAVDLEAALGAGAAAIPDDAWVLLVVTGGRCDEACERALWSTRQARLGLGHDARRVQRVLVLAAGSPRGLDAALRDAHPDLVVAGAPAGWRARLPAAPAPGAPPAVYLVDPRRFAALRYPADAPAKGIVEDLERLLRISTIG